MKTLYDVLLREERVEVIFATIHARFKELAQTLPRHEGKYHFLSARPEEIEDIALITLFNKRLTLAIQPLEEDVSLACSWVLKMGMNALGSRPRQMADRLADIVMDPPQRVVRTAS